MLFWLLTILHTVLCVAAGEDSTNTYDGALIANRTIERTSQLRTHSIYAPYIDQDLQNRWWDFGADAYVNTNKHIRLTRNKPSQMGWLWSRLPLTAHNWVFELEFKIGEKSTHLFGDGMAVWFTKDRAQPGPVFGSKDRFDGLGIFLDTYANGKHTFAFPRIVGMLGDGQKQYDLDTDGEANKIGACTASFRYATVPTKLKVSYVKDTHLDVKIQYKGWDEWMDCFSVNDIVLPKHPYIGISALTGDVSDPHDVISIATSSVVLSAVDNQRNSHKKEKSFLSGPTASDVSSFGFWVKLIIFVGICVGGWYGWKKYGGERRGGGMGYGAADLSGRYGGIAGGYGGGWQDSKRL